MPITTLSAVTANLPTDRAGVSTQALGDPRLIINLRIN